MDTTGEASGFVNKEIEYSTLALACYAFGQNFNVTPLSLINAQAACVNGGYLRTPYIVSEVLDQSGNVKYRHDTTPLRQVISEDTSKTVREIMEYEVEYGTGKNGKRSRATASVARPALPTRSTGASPFRSPAARRRTTRRS